MTETSVWPTLRAHDASTLIDFLVEGFGFTTVAVYGEGDQIGHAELAWPRGGGIMLGSARDVEGDPWPQQPGTGGAYVVTDDPDALFDRAVARGATVVTRPHDTDYGARECALRDPEGNLWSFGTYRGAPTL
jgi:uncharacterized glyoxalase superfamily protein PhnB